MQSPGLREGPGREMFTGKPRKSGFNVPYYSISNHGLLCWQPVEGTWQDIKRLCPSFATAEG